MLSIGLRIRLKLSLVTSEFLFDEDHVAVALPHEVLQIC